jgi:hypothetical protein
MKNNHKAIALIALFFILGISATVRAQDNSELNGRVDGIDERVKALEGTIDNLTKLKISGYVQPEWRWTDVDSLGNQLNTRNEFTIRRGRVKFVHTAGPISAVVYPDITENGVVMKEVYATWNAMYHGVLPELSFSMGAMNRPFGYEIAYSSSTREVTERSLAENRLFNGERDLGIQVNYTPVFGDFHPMLEVGLFNGSDNFGTGPTGAFSGGNNKMGFSNAPIGQKTYGTPSGADSAFQVAVNAAVAKEGALQLTTGSGLPGGTGNTTVAGTASAPVGQPGKELIGHIRLPFLISDELSFDVGASISMGGIIEPSSVIGKYSGTNGALVLENTGAYGNHSFSAHNNTFMENNRSVIGIDAQFYLSVLPIGGTIIKLESYSGQVPLYGSAGLFTASDAATLGAPIASTIYKNVMGYYAMLVQNITDNLQLAVRYEHYDPNTDVEGKNFAFLDNGAAKTLRGITISNGTPSTNFPSDLATSTITVDVNVFISGSMRLMFDWDHPTFEEFSKTVGTTAIATVADAHDDRFTFRAQYKF